MKPKKYGALVHLTNSNRLIVTARHDDDVRHAIAAAAATAAAAAGCRQAQPCLRVRGCVLSQNIQLPPPS